jgi:GntR family transcriptional regulator
MQIHISTKDGVPIFQQIVTQIKHMVASGRLTPGEIVPPIRVLAEQLLINPNTVARAYKELEAEGIFVSRQGSGTRVAEKGSPLDYSERLQSISKLVEGLLVEANQLDLNIEELIEIIKQKNHLFKTVEKGGEQK